VDATREDPDFGFGRLLNHSLSNPNLEPHKIMADRVPHIVMIASKDIEANTELVYDYGERDPHTLQKHSWLTSRGEDSERQGGTEFAAVHHLLQQKRKRL
jgi:histone-lysine N-methyltransferase SETD8